ncbi:phage tail protein [Klebsiella michiganensis]|uniref:phage tail-collar fiber domain-containing protein n=1 Tax=Klebsiella michiganensis TaxID=1134687 RepID=UPI00273834C3|nr:phage tail protein [Klebsiella michiganensis]WLP19069.1 phage tail protein [Klebsiella michiganensis]
MALGFTLTTVGAAEIEAAYQAGRVVKIKEVAIGDGGGVTLPVTPDELAAVTALFGAFGREPLITGNNVPGFISGEIYIDCKDYPGKTLRELGWISESGALIAYGVYPDSYLPAQTDSVIKEFIITMALELTHSSSVTLVVDADRALLTQDRADSRYLQREKNLQDISDSTAARVALGLGDSAVLDVGVEAHTVAAGDDLRITGALQKENNLSDLSDTSEALKVLGLNRDGTAYRAIVDAIFYVGIVVSGEHSPAEHFPWQTWTDLSEIFADRVVRIGSQYGVIGGSNEVKLKADNLPPHWHRSGDRSPGATWDPNTTHGTDNQKSGPLALTEGTYADASGLRETQNVAVDVTNEYVSLTMWKRMT